MDGNPRGRNMHFGYNPITVHRRLSESAHQLICDLLDPQIADVHAMMRLPIHEDAGLRSGCNLTAAQILLSIISGVSVTLFAPEALTSRGNRGRLFKKAVKQFYPWDQELDVRGRRFGADAANDLYNLFRNPLAHTLGVMDPDTNRDGLLLRIDKGPMLEAEIYDLEMRIPQKERWLQPTLVLDSRVITLSVQSLYWGTRQMIERIVETPEACAFSFPERTVTTFK